MSREFDHVRITAEQLEAAFEALDLTPVDLEAMTGVRVRTVIRWTLPAGHPDAMPPPFWITSWLALCSLPGGRTMAANVAAAHRLPRE